MSMMNWTNYFLNIAEAVKEKSKDQRTKIGAVIVGKDNEIVSTGYNSFPRGIDDDVEERQQRPEKYFWFEHAERNAIL
jgi:dCMP deaminase